MGMRNDYPYQEAISDLEKIFDKSISDKKVRREMQDLLDKCREKKSVPMRYIYEKFIKYRRDTSDFTDASDEDKKTIDDLFHFWG
ncbi:hypothetical protein [Photobacterium nomapromontoriensis]|uniref:hypothetical protein n=1 Tax=Photobacterium nomapromontoriensis TaxID=2910237 RepID=UPI003D0F8A9C